MAISSESELLLDLINLQTSLQRELAGPLSCHGISLSEFLVLRQLSLAPNRMMRRVDLAREVGLTASGITRLLNPMQKIGLVDKDESARDARVSLVTLTAAGGTIYQDACASFDRVAQSFIGPVSSKDRSAMQRVIAAQPK